MYNQSLASTVREVVEKQADNTTAITALTTQAANLTERQNMSSEPLTVTRSGKDENGIYVQVEWKTKINVLRKRSILTDADGAGNYRTQTVTKYAKDGITETSTDVYKRTFDEEGDLLSEVLQ